MSGPRIIICALAWQIIALMSPGAVQGGVLARVNHDYSYYYASQLGSRGFFGPYNVDNSASGDYAPLNGWLGSNLASGANAATASNIITGGGRWTYYDAITVSGVYFLGNWQTSEKAGAATPLWQPGGHWTLLYSDIQTPLGKVSFGKRGFSYGCGLQYAGSPRTEEFIILETGVSFNDYWSTYGDKFRSVFAPYSMSELLGDSPEPQIGYQIGESGKPAQNLIYNNETGDPHHTKSKISLEEARKNMLTPEGFLKLSPHEQVRIARVVGESAQDLRAWAKQAKLYTPRQYGGLVMGFGVYPWKRQPEIRDGLNRYWDPGDLSSAFSPSILSYIKYDSGNISCGVGTVYSRFHTGPESQQTTDLRREFAPLDRDESEGWIYLIYNNGRFFFRSEADWFYRTDRWQQSQDGTFFGESALIPGGGGSKFAPDYIESWRYMFEGGLLIGPWRFSTLYAFMPGPDRRHGIRIDRQPYITDPNLKAGNVFYTYSKLMSSSYRSGINSPGDMGEAQTLGFRIDYSIAANLNACAKFVKAYRNSEGYGYGYIRPDTTAGNFGKLQYDVRGSFTDPSPAIPTRDLGWEAGLGVQWQLLEGWQFGFEGQYFHPGDWFKYACIDKRIPDWDAANLTSANDFGVNHDRIIDPVFQVGFTFKIAP